MSLLLTLNPSVVNSAPGLTVGGLKCDQLRLTPMEHERLRNISYTRQLEAGMPNPGSAGLTADRFGDAKKWVPESAGSTVGAGNSEMPGKSGQMDTASLGEGSSRAHTRE